ncbi:hypothetical protein CL3_24510 [butyrate-producing bacterium SM4/1]|nr:hypothetical protein CL3_24510 [butyrate-producing bacterium SM4/1]
MSFYYAGAADRRERCFEGRGEMEKRKRQIR